MPRSKPKIIAQNPDLNNRPFVTSIQYKRALKPCTSSSKIQHTDTGDLDDLTKKTRTGRSEKQGRKLTEPSKNCMKFEVFQNQIKFVYQKIQFLKNPHETRLNAICVACMCHAFAIPCAIPCGMPVPCIYYFDDKSGLAQVLDRHCTGIAQAWQRHGTGVAQAWHRHSII